MRLPDQLSPRWVGFERRAGDVLLWAWIAVLALFAVLALHTTTHFAEIAQDVPYDERASIPAARDRTTVATVVSLLTVATVLLRRLVTVRWPPLWLVVLASVPATAVALTYGLSLAALWT